MTSTTHNWFLQDAEPVRDPRIPAGVEYHRALVSEKRRIPRGILAIVLLAVGLIGFGGLGTEITKLLNGQLGLPATSPISTAVGMLSLIALIPYSMLIQRVLYGVPAKSLHSVTAHFRFAILGRTLFAFGPFVMIAVAVNYLAPATMITWSTIDLVSFFLIGMLLSPLAAAGEEYGVRGLMFRVLGSWTKRPLPGLVLGIIGSTVLFSLIHGATDPFLFASYLFLFGSCAIVTWRTGGLEAAIVIHGVYNLSGILLTTTMHADLTGQLATRDTAQGTLLILLPSVVVAISAAVIWWMSRTTDPARTLEHVKN